VDYDSYDSIFKELTGIIDREQISIVYEDFADKPGELKEGEYRASTPKCIYIARFYEAKDSDTLNSEPLVIAHELGHYFDFKIDPDPKIAVRQREVRANSYMIEIAKRHNLLRDA
jgi:hypothetical protein